MENLAWYFDGQRWWMKALRFMNLLEPDRSVLSLTKVTAWATTIASLHWPDNMNIHALTAAAWIKHEVRRKEQSKMDDDK